MCVQRFMRFVDKNGPISLTADGNCWQWTGGIRGNGYGQFWYKGTNRKASRVSYELFVDDPGKNFVLHKCDNRLCVNPDHLFLGDHTANMEDRNIKGRLATGDRNGSRLHPECLARGDNHWARKHPEIRQGENNGRAVLTEMDVRKIRSEYAAGIKRSDLAKRYKLTWRTIDLIVKRVLWPKVT